MKNHNLAELKGEISHNTAGRFILLSRNGLCGDKMNLCFKHGPLNRDSEMRAFLSHAYGTFTRAD